jgi:hypothetical protein
MKEETLGQKFLPLLLISLVSHSPNAPLFLIPVAPTLYISIAVETYLK